VSATRRVLRVFLLLALLACLGGVYVIYRLEHPALPAVPAARVRMVFRPGTPTARIFQRLEKAGVVRDARLAEIYYRLYRSGSPLQAGEYLFSRPMPIDEIINRMARGEVVQYSIVVPEGLTAEETFELFWSQGIGGPEAFRQALADTELLPGLTSGVTDLEGFLFPETYVVTRSTSARRIVDRMIGEFRKNFTPEMRDKARELGFTPRQAVTLASIIEKESAIKTEGPLIAAVYINRLKKRMRLQADPTVAYAIKRDGQWTGLLRRGDYTYDSPYNTYTNDGLPPGPICNPGLAALNAAVAPANVDYLYFVADTTGGHKFTRTYEEHLEAISAARRLRVAAAEDRPRPAPPPTPHPTPAPSL
jgi:UPF0755 protein